MNIGARMMTYMCEIYGREDFLSPLLLGAEIQTSDGDDGGIIERCCTPQTLIFLSGFDELRSLTIGLSSNQTSLRTANNGFQGALSALLSIDMVGSVLIVTGPSL